MQLYGIIGAGGNGREVMPVAHNMLKATYQSADFEIVFVDDDESIEEANGHRVIRIEEFLAQKGEKFFNISIANYKIRERFAKELTLAGITPFSIRAQNNVFLGHNEIGEGDILCPFTTITTNVKIGKFFHANTYSYVAHDCRIGDFVTFAPKVACNGGVIIEDYAYIGTGAVIKQSMPGKPIVIGRGAVVGMGAVVTKSVAPFTTVVGNPAASLNKSTNKRYKT